MPIRDFEPSRDPESSSPRQKQKTKQNNMGEGRQPPRPNRAKLWQRAPQQRFAMDSKDGTRPHQRHGAEQTLTATRTHPASSRFVAREPWQSHLQQTSKQHKSNGCMSSHPIKPIHSEERHMKPPEGAGPVQDFSPVFLMSCLVYNNPPCLPVDEGAEQSLLFGSMKVHLLEWTSPCV